MECLFQPFVKSFVDAVFLRLPLADERMASYTPKSISLKPRTCLGDSGLDSRHPSLNHHLRIEGRYERRLVRFNHLSLEVEPSLTASSVDFSHPSMVIGTRSTLSQQPSASSMILSNRNESPPSGLIFHHPSQSGGDLVQWRRCEGKDLVP